MLSSNMHHVSQTNGLANNHFDLSVDSEPESDILEPPIKKTHTESHDVIKNGFKDVPDQHDKLSAASNIPNKSSVLNFLSPDEESQKLLMAENLRKRFRNKFEIAVKEEVDGLLNRFVSYNKVVCDLKHETRSLKSRISKLEISWNKIKSLVTENSSLLTPTITAPDKRRPASQSKTPISSSTKPVTSINSILSNSAPIVSRNNTIPLSTQSVSNALVTPNKVLSLPESAASDPTAATKSATFSKPLAPTITDVIDLTSEGKQFAVINDVSSSSTTSSIKKNSPSISESLIKTKETPTFPKHVNVQHQHLFQSENLNNLPVFPNISFQQNENINSYQYPSQKQPSSLIRHFSKPNNYLKLHQNQLTSAIASASVQQTGRNQTVSNSSHNTSNTCAKENQITAAVAYMNSLGNIHQPSTKIAPLPPWYPPIIPINNNGQPALPRIQPPLKLVISSADEGVCLRWELDDYNFPFEPAISYELYSYASSDIHPSVNLNHEVWQKVGDVVALTLPMVCTLISVLSNNVYYFIVRSTDRFHRHSDWSNIVNAHVS